jgi:hypothetical protein
VGALFSYLLVAGATALRAYLLTPTVHWVAIRYTGLSSG